MPLGYFAFPNTRTFVFRAWLAYFSLLLCLVSVLMENAENTM